MPSSVIVRDDAGWSLPLSSTPVVIGRGTANIDKQQLVVSRQQLQLTVNDKEQVTLRVLGANPVSVAGVSLPTSSSCVLSIGDHFDVLLSSDEKKRFTIERVEKQHAENRRTEEEKLVWSLDAYPAAKRVKIKPASSSSSSSSSTTLTTSKRHEQPIQAPPTLAPPAASPSPPPPPPPVSSSSSSATSSVAGLAFPCLCLSELFTQANAVCIEMLHSFLSSHSHPHLRLVVCTQTESSNPMFVDLQQRVSTHPSLSSDNRLVVHSGSVLTMPPSSLCSTIVNVTNWCFSDKGEQVRRAINAAANHQLTALTVLQHTSVGKVGHCYLVDISEVACELRDKLQIKHVLQVIAPAFNPSRADSILPQQVETLGIPSLQNTYRRFLDSWYQALHLPAPTPTGDWITGSNSKLPATQHHQQQPQQTMPQQQQDLLDKHTPSQTRIPSSTSAAGELSSFLHLSQFPSYHSVTTPSSSSSPGGWGNALFAYLTPLSARSASLQSNVFVEDSSFICIYDKYPKAQVHLLLITKHKPFIAQVKDLTQQHRALIQEMEKRGTWIIDNLKQQHNLQHLDSRIGFHAVPSLQPLHCHIISTDFDSPFMKIKKHWNSFTTDFFIPIQQISQHTESNASSPLFPINTESMSVLLNSPLRCHRCHSLVKTMPQLKTHIKNCKRPLPT